MTIFVTNDPLTGCVSVRIPNAMRAYVSAARLAAAEGFGTGIFGVSRVTGGHVMPNGTYVATFAKGESTKRLPRRGVGWVQVPS